MSMFAQRVGMPIEAVDETVALRALGALAQGARLRIFRTLVGAGPSGMTPGDLAAVLGVTASTLSFHLKELMHAGLVSQERDGRHLIYRPQIARMNGLLAYLTQHCCQGADCGLASVMAPSGRGGASC
ncbi:MAG: hypothetical protein KatS3mg122_1852 [Caldimonas sp.]|nr:MAG: hypothetical protein KatS3mg122_1852 [Caldimonas sp.]